MPGGRSVAEGARDLLTYAGSPARVITYQPFLAREGAGRRLERASLEGAMAEAFSPSLGVLIPTTEQSLQALPTPTLASTDEPSPCWTKPPPKRWRSCLRAPICARCALCRPLPLTHRAQE